MTESVETPRLRTLISEAIDNYLAANGGGFRLAFVYAVDIVDNEGGSAVMFGNADDQETYKSLGLTSYMDKWFDVEARELIARSQGGCDGCDECGDD